MTNPTAAPDAPKHQPEPTPSDSGARAVATRPDGTMMRAVAQHRYGGSEVLQLTEVPTPTIAEHDVLVRMRAAVSTAEPST